MENIIKAMKSLEFFRHRQPVSVSEVNRAEQELGLKFSEDYRTYVETFGIISAYSLELTGITESERLNVISATRAAWEFHNHVPRNFYLIEDAAFDGILIWQDSSGNIYETTPNQQPNKICSSLAEYVIQSGN